MQLRYKRFSSDVIQPRFASPYAACFDVCAYFGREHRLIRAFRNTTNEEFKEACFIEPGSPKQYSIEITRGNRYLIPTGLFFDMDPWQSAFIYSRSGNALKYGVRVCNSVGVIDADYYHEVYVILENISDVPFKINHGDRIAQVRIMENTLRTHQYRLQETFEELKQKTDRAGGFGSTGR